MSASPLTSEEVESLRSKVASIRSLLPYASARETAELESQLQQIEWLLTDPAETQESTKTALERYCPHKPWPKQQLFLDLTCHEALYGGAAGPGKTDALLMAALQYVDVPGYSALILRRDFPRLSLPGSIMDRAKQWLTGTDARWNSQEKSFRFPSGAVLQFGYIDSPDDRFRYASAEFQFIGWDELSEFILPLEGENNPYLFMMSRLRKSLSMPVPLRVRAATNPGNIGHRFCKGRFITDEALKAISDSTPRVFYADPEQTRAFVPAAIVDNPALDAEAYVNTALSHLPPVTRARLRNGDWSIIENGIFQPTWLRFYRSLGEHIVLLRADSDVLLLFDRREARFFTTADTAGTSRDKAKEEKGQRSWSVIGTWCVPPPKYGKFLILLDVWRKQAEFTDLCDGFRQNWKRYRCTQWVENKHFGPAVQSLLSKENIDIRLVSAYVSGRDGDSAKVERSAELQNRMERGEVFLPADNNSWQPEYISELLTWTGKDNEVNDQVDMSAYAAIVDGTTAGQAWGGMVQPGTVPRPASTYSGFGGNQRPDRMIRW